MKYSDLNPHLKPIQAHLKPPWVDPIPYPGPNMGDKNDQKRIK